MEDEEEGEEEEDEEREECSLGYAKTNKFCGGEAKKTRRKLSSRRRATSFKTSWCNNIVITRRQIIKYNVK